MLWIPSKWLYRVDVFFFFCSLIFILCTYQLNLSLDWSISDKSMKFQYFCAIRVPLPSCYTIGLQVCHSRASCHFPNIESSDKYCNCGNHAEYRNCQFAQHHQWTSSSQNQSVSYVSTSPNSVSSQWHSNVSAQWMKAWFMHKILLSLRSSRSLIMEWV